MDMFKATDGNQWYISIDGGETFEWCQREPFLNDKLAAPIDAIPMHDPIGEPQELTLSREQLEGRGFTIGLVTSR